MRRSGYSSFSAGLLLWVAPWGGLSLRITLAVTYFPPRPGEQLPLEKEKKSWLWYFLGTGPSVTACENIHWAKGPGLFYLSPPKREGAPETLHASSRCPPAPVIPGCIRGLVEARSMHSTAANTRSWRAPRCSPKLVLVPLYIPLQGQLSTTW